MAGFLKNVLKRQKKACLKGIDKEPAFWCGSDERVCRMWLGRGNELAHTPHTERAQPEGAVGKSPPPP